MKCKILILIALAAVVLACDSPGRSARTVRLMTYNVGVFDKYEESGIGLTASFINEVGPDVLILNEVDSCAARTGSIDQLSALVEAAGGYEGCFSPALKPFQGGAYGIAQMWKNEMRKPLDIFRIILPKGDGSEPRAMVAVEYEDMIVAGTHIDHRSKQAQLRQAQIITDTLASMYGTKGKPVFLCGDMNALPDSPTLKWLREHWDVLSPELTTYPDAGRLSGMPLLPQTAQDIPGKCIDYIMVLKGSCRYETVAAEVGVRFESGSAFTASDHLPVYVDVKIL